MRIVSSEGAGELPPPRGAGDREADLEGRQAQRLGGSCAREYG
jgi:hypothetical protein